VATPSPPPRRVRSRLLAGALAFAAIACFASLGVWQLGRAADKRAQAAAFVAGDAPAVPLPPSGAPRARYLRVEARGQYLVDRQFLLDNMTHAGQAGYRVLTPLLTLAGTVLLVDRGWIPAPASRAALPEVGVDGSERAVRGRLDALPRAGLHPNAAPEQGWPRRISYPTQAEIEQALGRPVEVEVLLLDAAEPDGFVRDWKPSGLTPERHLGYAFQWFALALTLAVLVLVSFLKSRESPE